MACFHDRISTPDHRSYGTQRWARWKQAPGYTGHVNDPDWGGYMQARYYDPSVVRLLGVDSTLLKPGEVASAEQRNHPLRDGGLRREHGEMLDMASSPRHGPSGR